METRKAIDNACCRRDANNEVIIFMCLEWRCAVQGDMEGESFTEVFVDGKLTNQTVSRKTGRFRDEQGNTRAFEALPSKVRVELRLDAGGPVVKAKNLDPAEIVLRTLGRPPARSDAVVMSRTASGIDFNNFYWSNPAKRRRGRPTDKHRWNFITLSWHRRGDAW